MHRADWRDFYGQQLSGFIASCESFQSNKDCGNPDTITCQAAKNYWLSQIQSLFALAVFRAQEQFNDPDTELDESEQRAYEIQYEFDHPISAALPEGCTP
jgi:hypothetical protein